MEHIIYKLVEPLKIEPFQLDKDLINLNDSMVIKPLRLAICPADVRYYRGLRNPLVLKKKLPMALFHEAVGEVVYTICDDIPIGTKVVMLPNILSKKDRQADIIENYNPKATFLSSNGDGFLQNFVFLPVLNVISIEGITDLTVASYLEPISVCVHAFKRLMTLKSNIKTIAIWGDGNLSFLLVLVIKALNPDIKIVVIGKYKEKLDRFTHADETKLIMKDYFFIDQFDVGFEVTGGIGSGMAINDIIRFIKPMGVMIFMGVSEETVSINTRNILEKGLISIGTSRSSREDFVDSIEILKDSHNIALCRSLLYKEVPIHTIKDVDYAFELFEHKKGRVVLDLKLFS